MFGAGTLHSLDFDHPYLMPGFNCPQVCGIYSTGDKVLADPQPLTEYKQKSAFVSLIPMYVYPIGSDWPSTALGLQSLQR